MTLADMLRASRIALCTLLLSGTCCIVSGAASSAPTEDAKLTAVGRQQLEEGRTTLDPRTLEAAKVTFDACLRANPRDAACAYGRARAEHYLVRAENFMHQTDAAKHTLDASIDDALRATSLDDRMADAHALLSDLYGEKITGAFSGMRYGPKANAECARALQLDPHNAQAFAVTGRKYLYSPAMFGGDIDKAIASFQKATAFDPHSDEDFVWLAIAYRKKGDAADAQKALNEALRLNKRSVFAQRVQAGAE